MALVESMGLVLDAILVVSSLASMVVFIDLLRRALRMPTDVLVARVYPLTQKGVTPWHLVGAGMSFLMVSLLLHGLIGLFAPNLLEGIVEEVVREILGAAGFVLQALGLVWFDRIVRSTWSPLVKDIRVAEP